MSARRASVRVLPQGATICGWCDSFEARAQKAEATVEEMRVLLQRVDALIDRETAFADRQATTEALTYIRAVIAGTETGDERRWREGGRRR